MVDKVEGGERATASGTAYLLPALRWSLTRPLKNAGTWIGGELLSLLLLVAVVFFAATSIGAVVDGGAHVDGNFWDLLGRYIGTGGRALDESSAVTMVALLADLLLAILLTRLALRDIDRPPAGLSDVGRGIPWGRAASAMLLTIAFSFFTGTYLLVPLEDWALPGWMEWWIDPPIEWLAKAHIGGSVVYVLLYPFTIFFAYFALDGHDLVDAARLSIEAGRHNYLRLLVNQVLFYLIVVVIVFFTAGLGALVVAPAFFLYPAYLFREVCGMQPVAEARTESRAGSRVGSRAEAATEQ